MRPLFLVVLAIGLFAAFVVLWPLYTRSQRPPDRIGPGYVTDPVLERTWDVAGRPMDYRGVGNVLRPSPPPGHRARRIRLSVTSWNVPTPALSPAVPGRVVVSRLPATGSPTRHWTIVAEIEVSTTLRRLTVRVPPLGSKDIPLDPLPERSGNLRVVDVTENDFPLSPAHALAPESRGAWRAEKLPRGWRFSGDPARAPLVVGKAEPEIHHLVQNVDDAVGRMPLSLASSPDGARLRVRLPAEVAPGAVSLHVFGRDGKGIRPRRTQAAPLDWTMYLPVPPAQVGGVELTYRRLRWRRLL